MINFLFIINLNLHPLFISRQQKQIQKQKFFSKTEVHSQKQKTERILKLALKILMKKSY